MPVEQDGPANARTSSATRPAISSTPAAAHRAAPVMAGQLCGIERPTRRQRIGQRLVCDGAAARIRYGHNGYAIGCRVGAGQSVQQRALASAASGERLEHSARVRTVGFWYSSNRGGRGIDPPDHSQRRERIAAEGEEVSSRPTSATPRTSDHASATAARPCCSRLGAAPVTGICGGTGNGAVELAVGRLRQGCAVSAPVRGPCALARVRPRRRGSPPRRTPAPVAGRRSRSGGRAESASCTAAAAGLDGRQWRPALPRPHRARPGSR